MSCDVGKATEGLENELWRRWSDGKFGEWTVTQVKQRKVWRMSCDVGKATDWLENELWRRRSERRVGEWTVTYVKQRKGRRMKMIWMMTKIYTGQMWPKFSDIRPNFPSLHLRHSSFSNPSGALPTSQVILQPFRCFTYVTAHTPTLLSLLLRHRLFTYFTWRAAHKWMVMIMTARWYSGMLGGLKLPDICLTGEEKPRKNITKETCPDRGSNQGKLRDRRARYRLSHSGGQSVFTYDGHCKKLINGNLRIPNEIIRGVQYALNSIQSIIRICLILKFENIQSCTAIAPQ